MNGWRRRGFFCLIYRWPARPSTGFWNAAVISRRARLGMGGWNGWSRGWSVERT